MGKGRGCVSKLSMNVLVAFSSVSSPSYATAKLWVREYQCGSENHQVVACSGRPSGDLKNGWIAVFLPTYLNWTDPKFSFDLYPDVFVLKGPATDRFEHYNLFI